MIKATISEAYSWESQCCQYPEKGPPGLSYFKGEIDDERYVDCLLWRHANGDLIGILNYYPFDFYPLEQKGNFGIWVHPAWQRQGIATALLKEADSRYHINFEQQKYTIQGAKFIKKFLNIE